MGCCACKCGSGWLVGVVCLAVVGAGMMACAVALNWPGKGPGVVVPVSERIESDQEGVPMQVLDFTMNRIDGAPQDLAEFRGKVVLIVNTASRCGLTPQYRALEDLYRAKQDKGLVILGFPANNFMGQEPGTDEDIAAFCERNYGVTFPMFSKISVKGDDIHPLYQRLTAQPAPVGGEIQWNFDKFLVDREGRAVARFGPRTTPTDAAFLEAIEGLLAERATGG